MKKVLSVLLALCLLIGVVPMFAFAEEGDTPTEPEMSIAYATTNVVGDEEFVLLEDVKDKLSTDLKMDVGEEKTIYPVRISIKEIDGQEQQVVSSLYSLNVNTTDGAVAWTDVSSVEPVRRVNPYTTITAGSPGSAKIVEGQNSGWENGVWNDETEEFIPLNDSNAVVEYLSTMFGEYKKEWGYEYVEEKGKDGSHGGHLLIHPNDSAAVEFPVYFRRGDDEVDPEWPGINITVSKPNQLYFYDGIRWDWNEELQADIIGVTAEGGYFPDLMNARVIDTMYFTFAIEGEDGYQAVDVSDLVASDGLTLEVLSEELIAEDSKDYVGQIGKLNVDEYDQVYTISYTDGETTYEATVDSHVLGLGWYTEPDLSNESLVNVMTYSGMNDQPSVYLGVKEDPEWEGHRRVASVNLREDVDDFSMEEVNDSCWKFTLKEGVTISEGHQLAIQVQWEHEEGEDNWVDDEWIDEPRIDFWPETDLAYATSDLIGDDLVYVDLADVKDQLSTELEMTVGETKTIYTYIVRDIESESDWVVFPAEDVCIAATDTGAISLSDIKGENLPVDVTAVKAGSSEILYSACDSTIFDNDGNEVELTDSDKPLFPVFAEYFDIPESEISEDGETIPFWYALVDDKLCLVFNDANGVERAYPNIEITRSAENAFGWPENNITVTVKEKKPAIQFADVPTGQYYTQPVAWAVAEGITNGKGRDDKGNQVFRPELDCTRAEIVTFLWRAMGQPEVAITDKFTDMPGDKNFQKAISWAVENGVTQGKSSKTFAPNATCTRAEAVTFIWRAMDKPEVTVTNKFADMPSTADFQKAISWAVENNVTKGKGATTFKPNDTCSRGEIVTFLYRALGE